jgi:ABC-2 type transport system permease protein
VSLAGKELLTYALHLFAASLYVSAFVAIAMALTGTFFSNVIVSGLLIFGPRILITVIKTLVMNYLPFVLTDRIGLLSNNYNVVNGIIFGLFGNNYSYSIVLNSPSAFWVTLAMGCILTVIAAVLFCHRPSEAAGKSAPNKVLGTVYRVSITYLASLLPVSSIFEHIINGTSYNRVSLYDLFIIYLLVVAVFYLYELFMTRSLRQLWKITPSLLWL